MNTAERSALRASLKRRAAAVDETHVRVYRNFRSKGAATPHDRDAYRDAKADMYDDEFRANLRSVRAGDVSAVDWAVTFLEASPRCYHAGYATERLLRYLSRMELDAEMRQRLSDVIVRAVSNEGVNASRLSDLELKPRFYHAEPSKRWLVGPQAVPREFGLYGRLATSFATRI